MEPVFDIYMGAVTMSGVTPRFVSLRPKPGVANATSDDWVLGSLPYTIFFLLPSYLYHRSFFSIIYNFIIYLPFAG
jgi:hypothetical protein